jgi:hypothetical protein
MINWMVFEVMIVGHLFFDEGECLLEFLIDFWNSLESMIDFQNSLEFLIDFWNSLEFHEIIPKFPWNSIGIHWNSSNYWKFWNSLGVTDN